MPITACTPLPTTAAAMPADRSPSPMRRMRAPVARMSAISFSWRGRDQLLHVEIGRVQQAAALGRRQHRDGVGRAGGAEVRALERIHGDVDLRVEAAVRRLVRHADLLADVEHRRLVALALADDDVAVDGDRVHLRAHRLDRHLVGLVAVALAHRLGAGDRRLLDHAQEVERQVVVHEAAAAPVVHHSSIVRFDRSRGRHP
jgi:hypothetical protein